MFQKYKKVYFSTQAKTGKQLMSTVGQLDSCDGRMGWQAGDGGGQQGLDRPQTKMAVTFAIWNGTANARQDEQLVNAAAACSLSGQNILHGGRRIVGEDASLGQFLDENVHIITMRMPLFNKELYIVA